MQNFRTPIIIDETGSELASIIYNPSQEYIKNNTLKIKELTDGITIIDENDGFSAHVEGIDLSFIERIKRTKHYNFIVTITKPNDSLNDQDDKFNIPNIRHAKTTIAYKNDNMSKSTWRYNPIISIIPSGKCA